MAKTVLITGGTGFIGGAAAARFLSDGWNVRILTRRNPFELKNSGAEFVRADYSDPASLSKAVSGCSAVVHLAGALFAWSREEFDKANAAVTANLAAVCAESKPEVFVHVSSLAAGGPVPAGQNRRDETMPDAPVSNYGASKLSGEKELSRLHPETRRVIFRPPIVYGKGDPATATLARWVKRGLMVCPPEAFFSFIYVEDFARCLGLALSNPAIAGKTYYVCEEKTYSWTQFIRSVAEACGRRPPLLLRLRPFEMKAAGWIYQRAARLAGDSPLFNDDKAREACAGDWTANPSRWMKDSGQSEWTPLCQGVKKTFPEL